MAIYDLLPKYHQIEANNLKALQPGFVVAQMPFKPNDDLLKGKFNVIGSSSTTVGHMVANGHIVTISKDGICQVGAAGDSLFISYNDPIVKVGPSAHYAFYATDLEEEHVRAVQLIPGDEWMSDIDYFEKTEGESPAYVYPGAAYLEGRIVKIGSSDEMYKSDNWFAMDELADGTKAFHYVFIK